MRCALILLMLLWREDDDSPSKAIAIEGANTPLSQEHLSERIENENYQERRAGGRTDRTLGRYRKQGCKRSERPEEKHH
jgi:hypothetical protein